MNILLISPVFPPEIGSSSQIYYDLATGLSKNGHNVHILTSYPRNYNLPYGYESTFIPKDENISGIFIHRSVHPTPDVNQKILRCIEQFYMPIFYFRKYKQITKIHNLKFDVCIIHTPPLPFSYLARLIKKRDGTPSIMNYVDFHPGELVLSGFIKNKLLIKVLEFIERSAYQKADYITSHSIGGVEYMTLRGADHKTTETVFNVVNLDVVDSPDIMGDFKQRENLENKFLISFGGRITPDGNYDKILAVADILQKYDDIIFYIVGNGQYKEPLEIEIKNKKLNNVIVKSYIPRDQYINFIKSSDLSIVSLNKTDLCPCVPGKLLNIMSLNVPVLGFLSENSEAAKIIRTANAGVILSTNDYQEIENIILSLKNNKDKRDEYGRNGRKFVVENMATEIAVQKYDAIFEKLNLTNK